MSFDFNLNTINKQNSSFFLAAEICIFETKINLKIILSLLTFNKNFRDIFAYCIKFHDKENSLRNLHRKCVA